MPGTLVINDKAAQPTLRLFDYGPDYVEERELADPQEVMPYLEKDSVTWLDVQGLGDEQVLRKLGEIFHIHPLALADVVNVPQRPKVEEYPHHEFIITRMAMLQPEGGLDTEQVSLFIGKNYLLTLQERYGDCFDPVRKRIQTGKGLIRKAGPDYLGYALIDVIIDHYYPLLEEFGEHLERLEDDVVAKPGSETLHQIYKVKRELLTLRRAIWPQRDMVNSLIRDESVLISEQVRVYLRDCYDHAVQIMDVVETYRELAGGLLDVYLSSVSNRMNEVMKVLTIIATIFIPTSFIAGIYGMNFEWMPELKWAWGYPAVWTIILSVVGGMIYFFKRLGWIGRTRS
jgi:magnesium transporter